MKRKLHYLVLAFFLIVLTNSSKAQPGNALNFDGSNDGVSIPSVAGFGVSMVTIETWVYWTPNAATDVQFICSKGLGAGTEVLEIHTGGTANSLRFLPRPNVYIDVANALPVNRWTHIAYVHDPSTSYLKIYINGVEKSYTVTLGSISTALTTSSNAFSIGKRSSNEYYFKGSIDEFRFWNVVRTQAEIQANMYNSISPSSTGLFAYYNFDASSGTSLADQTTNNNTGTLGGPFAFTGTTSNWTESYAMVVPTATAATNAYTTSLTANWTAPAVGTVTNYLLDVSTSSTFASFVSGYNGLSVSGTTKIVTGLTASTTYYYRVRADKTSVTGQGNYSNTITTATTNNALPPGNALNFDGTNDNVSLGTTLGNFGTGSFTVEAWFKTSGGVNPKTIIGKRKATSSGNYFRMAVTNVASFEINESNVSNYTAIVGSTVVNDGKWHHVAAVRTPTQILLYIDGKQEASPVTINGNPNISNSFQLSLGQILDNSSVPFEIFNGSLDEVRIWNTARTASEVQNNFMSIISNSAIGLLAYYNFDHGTAGGTNTGITTLVDQTSNANNGTLNGPFALTGATSNWVASTAWNTWTGATSNAFATASNWQLGSVPTTVDNIVIPTGASNLPVMVTGTEAVSITGIQTATSATVTGTLKIAGPIYNSGTLTSTAGTIELNGTNAQTIAASTFAGNTVQNLTINNTAGVTLGGVLNVTGTVTPTAGTLTTGGNLTLVSDASGTARIAQGSGSYISGTVKVQQYIPSGRRAFRFLGNPFNSSQNMGSLIDNIFITGDGTTTGTGGVTTGNGFDATTTNSASSYWFDNTASTPGAWKAFTSTADNSWSQYKGIRVLVRGDRSQSTALTGGNPTPNAVTLDMTGTLNTGNASISVPTASAYHLISNPYASPVDIGTVIDGLTSGVIGTQYWVWNANAAGVNNRGAYVTKTVGSGAYKLAMNGAFFVRPISGTTLPFTETNKQSTADNALFRTSTMQDLLELYLLYNNGQADNMFVRNSATALNASDNQDGEKLINPDINLYSLSSNVVKLSLDSRPLDLVTTIPLGFTTTASGTFSIAIASNTLNPSIAIYVKDKLLNTEQLLTSTAVFTFTVTADPATQGENRFELIFRNSATLPVTITNLKAYQKNTGVQVEWNTQNEQNLNSYEVEKSADATNFSKAGTVIASGSSSYNWFDTNPNNGNNFYRLKAIDKNGTFKYTPVINVKIGGKNAEFSVYPNPVKGGVVSLQMSNVEKGIYTVKIYNNIGQELAVKTINHNGGSATQTIDLGKGIASGSYNMQITNGTTVITKTVIVE